MGILVITDGKILVDGFNLSGNFNEMSVDFASEVKDATTFGSGGTRVFKPGLMSVQFAGKALQDHDDTTTESIDHTMFDRIAAVAASVFSFAREGNAVADVAFSLNGVEVTLTPIAGSVGDLEEFSFTGQGGGSRLIRGKVLALGTKVASAAGAAIQLGAVSATQRVYGALHAYGTVTGTLDMIVESDDLEPCASPTTRLTFAQKSAIGAEWKEAAGPITDTWWRASWTIGGGGSFPVFLVVAIH